MSIYKERPIRVRQDKDLNAVNLEKVLQHVDQLLRSLDEQHDGLFGEDFVTDQDIYCRDLITEGDSIYLGSKIPANKIRIDQGDLKFNEDKILTELDLVEIGEHVDDMDNPHQTTAVQVGALPIGTGPGDIGALPETAFSGLSKISVAAVAPTAPTVNDLWIDIS